MKIGDRVGAICCIEGDKIVIFGYGVFEGHAVPIEATNWLSIELKEKEIKNPKIRLDSGKIIYGCECWWASEGEVKKIIDKCKSVEKVEIDEVREKCKYDMLKGEKIEKEITKKEK